jgi:CBS domain-containing protein
VLLDLRSIHGDAALVTGLRRRIHAALPQEPALLYQLARNAVVFRPPTRLPGSLSLGGGGDHVASLDLKDALMPIVAYARVEAARHGIAATHTVDRIGALVDHDVLAAASRDELVAGFEFLAQLRLTTQAAALREGRPISSTIAVSRLTHAQRDLLKDAFAQIGAVQRWVSHDFPEPG